MDFRTTITLPDEVRVALEKLSDVGYSPATFSSAARLALTEGLKSMGYLPKDYRLPRPHQRRKLGSD